MLSTQPFFIGGIEDSEEAKSSAFGACGIFAFTFAASVLGIWYDNQNKSDVVVSSSAANGNGGGESEYHLAQGDFPNYGGTTSS